MLKRFFVIFLIFLLGFYNSIFGYDFTYKDTNNLTWECTILNESERTVSIAGKYRDWVARGKTEIVTPEIVFNSSNSNRYYIVKEVTRVLDQYYIDDDSDGPEECDIESIIISEGVTSIKAPLLDGVEYKNDVNIYLPSTLNNLTSEDLFDSCFPVEQNEYGDYSSGFSYDYSIITIHIPSLVRNRLEEISLSYNILCSNSYLYNDLQEESYKNRRLIDIIEPSISDGIYTYEIDSYNLTATLMEVSDKTLSSYSIPTEISANGFTYIITGLGQKESQHIEGPFSGCGNLNDIELPRNLLSIGYHAFYDCQNLTSIVIPESVSTISNSAFSYCSKLSSVTMPNCTSIGSSAFYLCSKLSSVTMPNCTSIGSYAFSRCSELSSVTMPNCTSIDSYAFSRCSELSSVTMPNCTSIGSSAFYLCSKLSSVTMPNCTSIGSSAFYGCSKLSSVTLPIHCTRIGSSAFEGCNSLTTVIEENPTPVSIDKNTFSNRTNAILIVPDGAKNAYNSANYWKEFRSIVYTSDLLNSLEIPDLIVEHGAEINLPVSMTNPEQITAAEFDLQVSNGVKLLSCSMTERKNGHKINFVQNGNNYHVTIFSLTSSAIDGNEGELLSLKLLAGAEGGLNLTIKNIELSTKEGERRNPLDVSATVTINDIPLGDVNGDGEVTITDAVSIVNHRLNRTPVRFISAAADLNADNEITITDAVRIVNMILSDQSNAKLRTESAISLPEPQ